MTFPPNRRLRAGATWASLLLLVVFSGCGDGGQPEGTWSLPAFDYAGRPLRPLSVPSRPPSLVLVVIDSLRADALAPPSAGTADSYMPFLARLASQGVSFRNAAASAPWTLPSMASLLTGLRPSAHGQNTAESRGPLASAVPTWAEVLRRTYGYDTAAFVDGPWFEQSLASLLQGFAYQETGFTLQRAGERVGAWAEGRDPERPFFLLLHTVEAHLPYGAPNHPASPAGLAPRTPDASLLAEPIDLAEVVRTSFLDVELAMGLQRALGPERLARLSHSYAYEGYAAAPRPDIAAELATAYWEGVRWVDGLLQTACADLQRLGLLHANTLLVVTGDHGEAFGEHLALGHGRILYDELVRVPLVLIGPGPFRGGRVIDGSVGLIDVLPTFFDLAGLHPIEDVDARSALPLLADPDRCRPVVSEERLTPGNTGRDVDQVRLSARTERWKYIVTGDLRTGLLREEIYDLRADPEESLDLADERGRVPDGLVLDGCLCPVVDALRAAVWGLGAASDDGTGIPYGLSRAPFRGPPPKPCRAARP